MTSRVIRIAGTPRTAEQHLMAALLHAGPVALASHESAAWLWQLPGFAASDVVTRPRSNGGRVELGHRPKLLLPHHRTEVRGIPCTTLPRTIYDIAGVLPTYHDAVFNGQPAKEGDGFTDEQLRVTFANEAGLQGADLTKFQQCYDSSATSRALRVEQEKAMPTFGGTTPQVTVNGKNPTVTGTDGKQQPWWQGVEPSVQAWEAAIKQYS